MSNNEIKANLTLPNSHCQCRFNSPKLVHILAGLEVSVPVLHLSTQEFFGLGRGVKRSRVVVHGDHEPHWVPETAPYFPGSALLPDMLKGNPFLHGR